MVNDPGSIDTLRDDGNNLLVIPLMAIDELDGLKQRPDIGDGVREALRRIKQLDEARDPSLQIWEADFRGIRHHVDRNKADHHIIVTALNVLGDSNLRGSAVVLVSDDTVVQIMGRRFGVTTEEYKGDRVEMDPGEPLPTFEMNELKVDHEGNVPCDCAEMEFVPLNGGAIFKSGNIEFAAIRKGGIFRSIKTDIEAFGIAPYSNGDNQRNWAQAVALAQLLDPEIQLITFDGGAGSGKTLLALAAALHQRARYRQILVSRPHVHLSDKDTMGYLPGDINEKCAPWLLPVRDNLLVLREVSRQNAEIMDRVQGQKAGDEEGETSAFGDSSARSPKLEILPLDYVRGRTLTKIFLIVDEAQNLNNHQVKTIITRAGQGTKIVLTGDLDQIDVRWLDSRSSGLAYVASKFINQPIAANTYFNLSVRSELAKLAATLL